ncbi:MAG: dienelactone hydrolase family protein [Candidatus Riflebacteria bacterium]|nr:dienelactone hydrolase family protein [Candidatus Riflebacteria bacterium]
MTHPSPESPEEKLTENSLRLVDGRVPALVVCRGAPEEAGRRGTILFHHGFTADKQAQRPELRGLARRGFLAVEIDAGGHGEQRFPDFETRFSGSGPDFQNALLDVVEETAAQTPALIDDLSARGWARPGSIGMAGISMGGFITYRSLLLERRLEAVVALLGSPRFFLDRPASPHRHPDRFFPTALLSLTAGADECVDPAPARELHRALTPLYAARPERLDHEEYPGAGHMVGEDVWKKMRRRMEQWFDRFLGGQQAGGPPLALLP